MLKTFAGVRVGSCKQICNRFTFYKKNLEYSKTLFHKMYHFSQRLQDGENFRFALSVLASQAPSKPHKYNFDP